MRLKLTGTGCRIYRLYSKDRLSTDSTRQTQYVLDFEEIILKLDKEEYFLKSSIKPRGVVKYTYDPHKWIPKGILILTTRRPLSGLLFLKIIYYLHYNNCLQENVIFIFVGR